MWVWSDAEGTLSRNGRIVSRGYSGLGRGKNNPSMVAAIGVGPIPPGMWRIVGLAKDDHTGPYSIILEPEPGTDTLGRAGFRIHGDSISHPGEASHGCIILPRAVRNEMIASHDDLVCVV